nr:MAG TPA: hypothetical protein [Caudoviricetes sp.]
MGEFRHPRIACDRRRFRNRSHLLFCNGNHLLSSAKSLCIQRGKLQNCFVPSNRPQMHPWQRAGCAHSGSNGYGGIFFFFRIVPLLSKAKNRRERQRFSSVDSVFNYFSFPRYQCNMGKIKQTDKQRTPAGQLSDA